MSSWSLVQGTTTLSDAVSTCGGVDRREGRDRHTTRCDGTILGCLFTDASLPGSSSLRYVPRGNALFATGGKGDIQSAADGRRRVVATCRRLRLPAFAAGCSTRRFAASILPISTPYAVWRRSRFELATELPRSAGLFTGSTPRSSSRVRACSHPAVPLIHVMVLSQVVNGVVCCRSSHLMLLLTNDRELMVNYVNSRSFTSSRGSRWWR